jgi:hypothetical protein
METMFELFSLMSKNHGLTLTEDELAQILQVCRKIDNTEEMAFKVTKLENVVTKGKLMRDAQKQYFKNRDGLVLKLSKKLEKEFDDLLEKVKSEIDDPVQVQQSLF